MKPDLVAVLQRHDRGLLCYDKLSPVELQEFARNRDLHHRERGWNAFYTMKYETTDLLIPALEKSDQQLGFPRFTELPAELRILIYGFYISDFPDALRLPTKPPLSRTCKLLQQEVLPVFYGNLEFELELHRDPNTRMRFAESIATQLFLLHLATADAACIRRLKLVVTQHRSNLFPGADGE